MWCALEGWLLFLALLRLFIKRCVDFQCSVVALTSVSVFTWSTDVDVAFGITLVLVFEQAHLTAHLDRTETFELLQLGKVTFILMITFNRKLLSWGLRSRVTAKLYLELLLFWSITCCTQTKCVIVPLPPKVTQLNYLSVLMTSGELQLFGEIFLLFSFLRSHMVLFVWNTFRKPGLLLLFLSLWSLGDDSMFSRQQGLV